MLTLSHPRNPRLVEVRSHGAARPHSCRIGHGNTEPVPRPAVCFIAHGGASPCPLTLTYLPELLVRSVRRWRVQHLGRAGDGPLRLAPSPSWTCRRGSTPALKKLAAVEAARGSFAAAVERATGRHMGKGQVERFVQRAVRRQADQEHRLPPGRRQPARTTAARRCPGGPPPAAPAAARQGQLNPGAVVSCTSSTTACWPRCSPHR